jgi:hypothetical protein
MYPEEITRDYFIISLCTCEVRTETEEFLAKNEYGDEFLEQTKISVDVVQNSSRVRNILWCLENVCVFKGGFK